MESKTDFSVSPLETRGGVPPISPVLVAEFI
jgi:hypothetical protein